MTARGFVVAAPASGSGKTLVTLALLRHLRRLGVAMSSFKVGPDYIDPAFHAAASGRPCVNLDAWAMRPETVEALACDLTAEAEFVIGEGVMGLFDGAPDGGGSTADVAALLGLPVVLVVDARAMGESAAALVQGFARFHDDLRVAGVLFNRIGGDGHLRLLEQACGRIGVPVLGGLRRDERLALPERHLGLVQATETGELDARLDAAAEVIATACDVDGLLRLAAPFGFSGRPPGSAVASAPDRDSPPLPVLGQRTAVAHDAAFAFAYPHLLQGWRAAGAELSFFSPLADEAPDPAADAIFLPGGYPELHAARLAAAARFLAGLRAAAARGAAVYGECAGYMVLGTGLVDADGARHAMAGLLPVETSFRERRLHLGYRRLRLAAAAPLGPAGAAFRGHEFHYATLVREDGPPLFDGRDALGRDLSGAGCLQGTVVGSFLHLIDRSRDGDGA
jgi:cobyrinic acid a,c-diamide synthase